LGKNNRRREGYEGQRKVGHEVLFDQGGGKEPSIGRTLRGGIRREKHRRPNEKRTMQAILLHRKGKVGKG